MELTFQEEWNLKFGKVKPPEWVFKFTTQSSQNTSEDVRIKIADCETRIETLRSELNQQLFLLEWLHKKATEDTSPQHHQQDKPSNHVQQLEEKSICHSSDLLESECQDHKDKSETLGEQESSYQDSDNLPSQSEESFFSTTEVLEDSQPASLPADIKSVSLEDLVSKEREVPTSLEPAPATERIRRRFIHRVDSKDVQTAKTVTRRLFEQGRKSRSYESLDYTNKTHTLTLTLPAKFGRAKSDQFLLRITPPQPFPTTSVTDSENNTKALSESLYSTKTQQEVYPTTEIEQTSEIVDNLSSREETQENHSLSKDKVVRVSQIVNQTSEDSDTSIEILNGHIMSTGDVEKRRSQDDEDMRRWSLGKRASNGISYDTGFTVLGTDDDSDPAVLNILANRIRASLRSPRTSLDHVRDHDESSLSNGSPKEITTPREHHRGNLRASGGAISDESNLTMTNEGENYKPVFSKVLVDTSASVRISQTFSEDECITPRGGESDNSMNFSQDSLLEGREEQHVVGKSEVDPVMTLTKERMDTKLEREKVGRKEVSNSAHESRMERLKQGIYTNAPYDRHYLEDSTKTLTHGSTGKFTGYDSFEELEDLAPLGSLENAIRTTLDKIRSTPEMSMATLLDVEENKEMNARFQDSSSEPSFSDSDLTESIEPDEATICAYTLRNEMYSSRSNSASSLPGLFGGSDPNLSSSPPEMESPSHSAIQGVNLRHTAGSRRRDRKRMGNAELDMITGASDEGSDLSPSHTTSSRSRSPTSEDSNSVPVSPISPRGLTGSDSSVGTAENSPKMTSSGSRSSRLFPVRHSTVVVHGEQLVIRKLVVAGIVSAEKTYIDCLTVAKEYYRKPLLARLSTTQPICTEEDINTIFYRVEDLYELHNTLHEKLEPYLTNWSVRTCVGDFFVQLCRSLKLYKDYVEMYHRAVECLNRNKTESAAFKKFIEDIQATVSHSYKEVPKVNELLRRPVERLQSYSLVLNDLCQHTPDDHPDYRILREALHVMSAFIASTHDPQSFKQLSGGFNRELLKEGLVVELSEGIRKVRRLFLFHDVLVSSKQKPSRGTLKFEPKWHLSLKELTFKPPEDNPEAHRPVPVTSDMELSVMKNKIAELKAQLTKDSPHARERSASSSGERETQGFTFKRSRNLKQHINMIKTTKSSERVKKRLEEQKVSLWVASPSLPLRLYGKNGKQYVFLLHNEEERESWVSAIKKVQPKAVSGVSLSSFELQDLLNRQTINDLRKVEEMIVPLTEDEYLSGILRVRVVSANDLKAKPFGLYCCLELDEYGKFERKARTLPTNTDTATLATTWDQDFEVELTGAHIMKIQVCSKSLLKEETYAHGKIRLPIKELKQSKRQRVDVNLVPQGSITLIIEYFSSLAAMGRKPSLLSSGVFGVPIEVVAK